MRIAQAYLGSHYGGAERHAVELANELATRHEVFFLAPRGSSRLFQRLDARVQPVSVARFPFSEISIAWTLSKLRVDLVDCHSPRTAQVVSRLPNRAPCVGTVHSQFGPRYLRCDGVVCVARWQAATLQGWTGKTAIVHNWCQPGRAVDAGERCALRASLGASARTKVGIAVGRLHHLKRFDILLEAFSQLPDPDVQLWICGDGKDLTKLQKRAGGNARMLGFRDDSDRLMRAADFFVSASELEACPLSVLEAMDAGLPLLLTDIRAHRELADGKAVFFERGSAATLVAALKAALSSELSRVSYDMSEFRVGTQTAKIESFYERMLS